MKMNALYASSLQDRFKTLHNECKRSERKKIEQKTQERQRTEQQRQEGLQRKQMREHELYIQELCSVESRLLENEVVEYREQRLIAIAQTKADSNRIEHFIDIDQELSLFAAQYEISQDALAGGCFNAYEFQLHQEFVEHLQSASQLHEVYRDCGNFSVFLDVIGHGVAYGIEANTHNQPIIATRWADAAGELIEVAQAVAEGVICGVYNTVEFGAHVIQGAAFAVMHPREAFNTLGCGIAQVCSIIAAGVSEVANQINFDADNATFTTDVSWQDLEDYVFGLGAVCLEKLDEMPRKDKIKHTATFVTEVFAPAKIGTLIRLTCNRMKPLITGALTALRDEKIAAQIAGTAGETFLARAMHEGEKIGGAVKEVTQGVSVLANGYYEVNGFKFTQFYYDRLWATGRGFPGFRAEAILRGAQSMILDPRGHEGFYKYISDGWEMIFNPTTKVVAHLSPITKIK